MLSRPIRELSQADGLRLASPEEALSLYLGAEPESVLQVEGRLEWVLDQLSPVPPERCEGLFEVAAERSEGLLLARVLNALAVIAWYRGDVDRAEALWRRELGASRERRDRGWVRAQNNLALCLSRRGAYFQALVLFGAAARASEELSSPHSRTYAHCRRGQMLALLGDAQRAGVAFDAADEAWTHVETQSERDFLASSLVASRARLHLARRDWSRYLESQLRRIELLRGLPEEQSATLADAHTQRLRARMELEPERGEEWLRELEDLGKRYEVNAAWRAQWSTEVARARLHLARARGTPHAEVRALTESFIDALLASAGGSERIVELIEVAEASRGEELTLVARRAFDLAATTILRQLVESERLNEEIPELAEATLDDWALLGEYRQRLAERQGSLMQRVAQRFSPRDRAFEQVVVNELIRLCAWCSRLRTIADRWIPVAEFLPETTAFDVTHVICPECAHRQLKGA